jgi:hypothetical protein
MEIRQSNGSTLDEIQQRDKWNAVTRGIRTAAGNECRG